MALPLPAAMFEDRPFWTGGAEGDLLIQWCTACEAWQHPPRPLCRRCRRPALESRAVSGRGSVFTFTVNHQPWTRDLDLPYVLAIVALDEDPALHVSTRLVGIDPAQAHIGLQVRVEFEQHGDVWLPLFTPIEEAAR